MVVVIVDEYVVSDVVDVGDLVQVVYQQYGGGIDQGVVEQRGKVWVYGFCF